MTLRQAWRLLRILCIVATAAVAADDAFAGDAIDRAIEAMSDDEKIAQLMIVSVGGRHTNAEVDTVLRDRRVGGVVLYASNLGSPRHVRLFTASLARAARGQRPFIGLDQEGGIVRRLRGDFAVLPSAMALGASRSPDLARRAGQAVGSELRDLGFDMNFAPVLDVLTDQRNASIGTRSFSDDPELVATMGRAFIDGQAVAGVVSVSKHFPGLGGVAEDTHETLPVLAASAAQLRARELVPFRKALGANLGAVMAGHVAVPTLTGDERLPGTISRRIMTDLLRTEMRFDGVVIADALQMKALDTSRGAGALALKSILAGADMILALGKRAQQDEVFYVLRDAYRDGRLPKQRVHASLRRILMLKQAQRSAASVMLSRAERLKILDEIAAAAVTVVGSLPALSTRRVLYVGPDGPLREALNPALFVPLPHHTPAERHAEILQAAASAARRAEVIVVAAANPSPFELANRLRTLLPDHDFVFVNLGSPWRVIRGTNAATVLTYAEDPRSQEAAARALMGTTRATGVSPVTLEP